MSDTKPSYKPIYMIFGYLIVINFLISYNTKTWDNFMPNFMAGFFLIFSFFKLLDLKGFADSYSNYDVIARSIYIYGYVYPFLELVFAVGYIIAGHNFMLNIVVFIVMLISSVGVIQSKLSKNQFQCACVGTFLKVPLGNIAIIEDILMVIMSLIMILRIHP